MSTPAPLNAPSISDWFWDIVQRADKDSVKLDGMLQELSNDQLRRFAMEFHEAGSALWGEPYTSYLTYGSEDGVADFSYWVVSQGKDFYLAVWHHPETLAPYTTVINGEPETLWARAESILYDRLGDAYDDDDYWDIHHALHNFALSGHSSISDYLAAQPSPES